MAVHGVEVHGITFQKHEATHYSRMCKHVHLVGLTNEQELVSWLIDYTKKLANRPVVIPTSDSHALMLSRYYERLVPHCRIWNTQYQDLLRIVDKSALYEMARGAGCDVVPSIQEPSLDALDEWCESNSAPYCIKPFYLGIANCNLREKNLSFSNRDGLMAYVNKNGSNALVIQRIIKGGDGYIFDCYGLCDASGRVLTMASHRRWRQHLPDMGATSFGEIPGIPTGKTESHLFEITERLLAAVRYHGIFGIEWLQDRETGKLYIIDFNARAFLSIGHLTSCGLNLPFLAYQDLVDDDLSHLSLKPKLVHKYWTDLRRDLGSMQIKHGRGELSWREALSTLKCRSFAYWDISDPGPGLYALQELLKSILRETWKQFFR